MARRRVVRIFKFDRILVFFLLVSFAVALTAIALSIEMTPSMLSVKKRSVYVVTFDTCATQSEARLKSEECFSRGGAGNIFESDSGFEIAASLYVVRSDAEAVKERMDKAKVVEISFPKVRLDESMYAKTALNGIELCYYTMPDSLFDSIAELENRNIGEAVAIEKCRLLSSEAARLSRLCEAASVLSNISDAERAMLISVAALLRACESGLDECIEGEGALNARMRRAQVSCALSIKEITEDLK